MAFKQQMDIRCSSKAQDIACALLKLKSYPSLYNRGKTTMFKAEQATESALHKPPSIHTKTAETVSLLWWRRKRAKGWLYVGRNSLCLTETQSSAADAWEKRCTPPPQEHADKHMFWFTAVMNLCSALHPHYRDMHRITSSSCSALVYLWTEDLPHSTEIYRGSTY